MNRIVKWGFLFLIIFGLGGCVEGASDGTSDSVAIVFKDVVADVGKDVCSDFDEEFVENVIGADILRVEQKDFACIYFLDEEVKFVTLTFYERSYLMQESGLINLQFYLWQDEKIKVDHQIASVDEETIWSLFLRVDDEHYYSVNYSGDAISDEQLVDLAGAISEKLVN